MGDSLRMEVIGNQFGGAEILHGFGNLEAEFFAEGEVCVNRVARRENYCGVIGEIDSLLPEFAGSERFDSEKRPENQLCAVLGLYGFVCAKL